MRKLGIILVTLAVAGLLIYFFYFKRIPKEDYSGTYHVASGFLGMLSIEQKGNTAIVKSLHPRFWFDPFQQVDTFSGKVKGNKIIISIAISTELQTKTERPFPPIIKELTFEPDSKTFKLTDSSAPKGYFAYGYKVKSEKEREGFLALYQKDYQKAATILGEELAERPDNYFAKLGRAVALQSLGNFDAADLLLEELKASQMPASDPWLQLLLTDLSKRNVALKKSQLGENATDDFKRAVELMPKQLLPTLEDGKIVAGRVPITEANVGRVYALVTAYENSFLELEKAVKKDFCYFDHTGLDERIPFLPLQTMAKVWVLKGLLLAYRGDFRNSARIFGNVVRAGQLLESGSLISHLIGYAIRSIGMSGFKTLALYKLSAPELEYVIAILESLEKKDKPLTKEDVFSEEIVEPPENIFTEAMTRGKLPRVKLAMAKVAFAAKLYQLKEGRFPHTVTDLVPNYLAEVPKDIFVSDALLRGILSDEHYIIYSCGPDRKDDFAKVEYDPTNGITSAGDISFLITGR